MYACVYVCMCMCVCVCACLRVCVHLNLYALSVVESAEQHRRHMFVHIGSMHIQDSV